MKDMALFNTTSNDIRTALIDAINNADNATLAKMLGALQNLDDSRSMFDIDIHRFNEESRIL